MKHIYKTQQNRNQLGYLIKMTEYVKPFKFPKNWDVKLWVKMVCHSDMLSVEGPYCAAIFIEVQQSLMGKTILLAALFNRRFSCSERNFDACL